MILYSHPLYDRLAPYLGIFERKVAYRESGQTAGDAEEASILLFGLGRFGAAVAANLRSHGYRILAVDFDPEVVRLHTREGYAARYGDAEDPEFLATLPLDRVRWVISTIRDRDINRMLLSGLRQQGYNGRIALSTAHRHDAQLFERDGIDLVLVPYADAAKEAAERILSADATPGNRSR